MRYPSVPAQPDSTCHKCIRFLILTHWQFQIPLSILFSQVLPNKTIFVTWAFFDTIEIAPTV